MLAGTLRFLDPNRAVADERVGLAAFVKTFIALVSTDAIYGVVRNPFQDQRVLDALWQVFQDFGLLGLNFFPNILAPKGSAARMVIFNAMREYYAADGQATASRIVRDRFVINKQYDVPQQDIEHFDLALSFGLLANAPAAMFWIIFQLYSSPSLLSEIRQTIEELPSVSEDLRHTLLKGGDSTTTTVTVNVAEVADSCPLLTSFVNETLRVHSTSASARIFTHNTILGGQYLLKKGSFIMSPSAVIHGNERAWGPTATEFDAFRFVPQDNSGTDRVHGAKEPKVSKSANRSRGGGVNMCPGRHFAMRELLLITVITVLSRDIHPVSGPQWTKPKTKGHMVASIIGPIEDFDVWVRRRRDRHGVNWKFTWPVTK